MKTPSIFQLQVSWIPPPVIGDRLSRYCGNGLIPVRLLNLLESAEIETVEQLAEYTIGSLLDIKGMGGTYVRQIIRFLHDELGLKLKDES